MYAVVYKNKVIVGPMGWNRGIFQGSLEKQGVSVLLPRAAPEILPFIVNDDTKIMLVEENRPTLNEKVEYYYGPLWEIGEDKVIANYEIHDTPIDFARTNFKNLLSEERWKKEVMGIKITIRDHEITIDTSRDGRNIFVQKFMLMGENDVVNWKFPEGWLTLTKSELGQIISAGANYIQECFDWEKNISDQIDQAATKHDLLSILIIEPTNN